MLRFLFDRKLYEVDITRVLNSCTSIEGNIGIISYELAGNMLLLRIGLKVAADPGHKCESFGI